MTKLERNARLFQVLNILGEAYESGDFAKFVPLLEEDCVYESMWVLEPLRGREAVADHLLGKGKAIRESGTFPDCQIAELVGNWNPIPDAEVTVNGEKKHAAVALAYGPGKFCLMMEQTLNAETNQVLLDLKLTENGMVSRIDLCMPELFQTRSFFPYVTLLPANGEVENEDALIRIGDAYFNELYLFFGMAGLEFDEYYDLDIPMEKWVSVLEFWKEFVQATDYDTIAEKFAGIDYDRWSVSNKDAFEKFSASGAALWRSRRINAVMLNGLWEWTRKYRGCANIHIYGF